MNHSKFIISLDFELIWGVFDKVNFEEKQGYFLSTRKMIPALLKIFDNYGIHATWATVGMLFNRNWEEWIANIPDVQPAYANAKLSAYQFGLKNKDLINDDLCFANQLIQKIIKTPGQEMATHSYSHYYCLEEGQTKESFRSDLEKAISIASVNGIQINSLVFPRNQFNADYLRICSELGIKTVRTNPDNWYWKDTQGDSLKNKIFRTGDAYFGLQDKAYHQNDLNSSDGSVILQKASRLLRPKEGNMMDNLKLKRILGEMSYAAKKGLVYHLWWHPHNFGNDVTGNLDNLKVILDHYKTCKAEFGMQSLTMLELAENVSVSSR